MTTPETEYSNAVPAGLASVSMVRLGVYVVAVDDHDALVATMIWFDDRVQGYETEGAACQILPAQA